MLKPTLLMFVIFSLISISKCKAINYCKDDICGASKRHTLCTFQSYEPASHCLDFEVMIKTPEDKLAVLDKINNRRNKVASGDIRSLPSADNMLKMVWNVELEKSAQRWANQCVRHNVPDIQDNNCRNLENVYVGQNIATIHGDAPGLTPLVLVDVWYMELLHINASVLSRFQPYPEMGHSHYDYFTQLVWAESSEVGCGAVKFKERYEDVNGLRNRTIYRLVCNFAPGGNRRNQTVYTSGSPCSRCPLGFTCDSTYTSLCSSNHKPDINNTKMRDVEDSFMPASQLISYKYGYNSEEPVTQTTTYLAMTKDVIGKNSTLTIVESDINDDYYTFFDYISHLHEFTRNKITDSTVKKHTCKDVLAVEEFIELLKKRLSTDAVFKNALMTSAHNDQPDSTTDPSVVAFVSRIYSKKMPLTTRNQVTESNAVNSTLLVDLVEAVIFRSGAKVSEVQEIVSNTPSIVEVNPIKVRAELAEIKQNQDFTGHYFFPEEDEETTSESTESYYDTSNLEISDVVFEIEELQRTTTSKDFLDEILESDSITENSLISSSLILSSDFTSHYNINKDVIKNFFKDNSDKI